MVRAEEWIEDNGQPRYGSPLGILLSAHAAATPDRLAWSMGDTSYDFATFDRMANRRARALTAWGIRHGDKVVLTSPLEVTAYVRLGWSHLAEPNLRNKEGLPAFPFTTEEASFTTLGPTGHPSP